MKTNTYRLYIGFRLLGEFPSIWQAKQFAQECGESDVFSLVGDDYRDSWYAANNEVEEP